MSMNGISLGCNGRGLQHTEPLSVDAQFRLLRESGVFDHFDRIPLPGEERAYVDASNKYGIPMTTGLWTYQIGRDEAMVRNNLEWAQKAGAKCHNLMILTRPAAECPLAVPPTSRQTAPVRRGHVSAVSQIGEDR